MYYVYLKLAENFRSISSGGGAATCAVSKSGTVANAASCWLFLSCC